MRTATDKLVAAWGERDGAIVDVDETMMHLALEVVGHALFGSDLSGDAERLALPPDAFESEIIVGSDDEDDHDDDAA